MNSHRRRVIFFYTFFIFLFLAMLFGWIASSKFFIFLTGLSYWIVYPLMVWVSIVLGYFYFKLYRKVVRDQVEREQDAASRVMPFHCLKGRVS